MKLGTNALTVLEKRYLKRDAEGNVCETAQDMFMRVAESIAQADKLYNKKADIKQTAKMFYDMMVDLEFLPNSPTLMNAGRDLGQLSACFVLPIEDTMEGIFESVKQAALIHKSGGGTGFSFSRLRHTGSVVRTTGGVASGPISFMRVFNMATEAVKQGGTRRGANMGILRIDHPDILGFIDCKKDNADITNFNISVGITEEFMEAVKAGRDYDLIDPKTKKVAGQYSAPEVFGKIVEAAWRNGEPGIIFLDRLNRDNVVPAQGEIESTNPCGEQPLLPYESCNLGSINLINMLKQDKKGNYQLDYDKLGQVVEKAVHFLDNVIDVNKYPIQQIDFVTKQTRKIGLGVMGYADMLLLLGLAYDSEAAVLLSEQIMSFITQRGRKASAELAKVRGAFPLFAESIFKDEEPLRNATITTIAPTGTLSIIAGCSSGVEPVFAYVYIRNVMDNTEMVEVSPILKAKLEAMGLATDEIMRRIATEGTLAHINEIPAEVRDVFVCSHDVAPQYHVKTQAAFQRYTDNAVSKTVNFSNSATMEEVREVYMLAYELDCKGVTIYRDGSRDGQVLNIGAVNNGGQHGPEVYPKDIRPRPRPEVTYGMTERARIGCGNLYITVNYDENGICEVFTSTGKAGGCPSQSEATARLVSIALRSGISVDEILDQLKGIRCPSTIRQAGMKCTSCPDAIGKMVKRVDDYVKALAAEKTKQAEDAQSSCIPASAISTQLPPKFCAQCGAKLVVQGGAAVCVTCGLTGQKQQPTRPTAVLATEEVRVDKNSKNCPECGQEMEHEGGCVSCRTCGYSKCN